MHKTAPVFPDQLTRRKIIAAAGILIHLCLGTVYAWSIFKKPLMAGFGWSEIQTQSAFMTYGIMIGMAAALGGVLVDRKSPRIIGLLGGLLFGIGIILAGFAVQIRSLPLLIIGYGVIGAFGAGLGYVTPVATLIRWFPDKRGLLTGLVVMGYGMGSFVLGNIGPTFIIDFGVAATFYAWGGIGMAVILMAAMILENPPPGWSPPAAAYSPSRPASVQVSSTWLEALKMRRFWILYTILFAGTTAGLGMVSQLSPIIQDILIKAIPGAISPEQMKAIAITAGTVVALAGIFNGLGRFFWAWMSDYIGRKTTIILIFISLILGFSSLAHLHSFFIFAGLCFYIMACYGGILATMPALAADEFGSDHIGRIYGALFTASSFGGLCGTYVFALTWELTGGFTYALYLLSGLALMGLVAILLLKKLK